jgi:hypothetical protein
MATRLLQIGRVHWLYREVVTGKHGRDARTDKISRAQRDNVDSDLRSSSLTPLVVLLDCAVTPSAVQHASLRWVLSSQLPSHTPGNAHAYAQFG